MRNFDIYGLGAALVDTEIEVSERDLKDLGIEKGIMTLVDETRQAELLSKFTDHMKSSKRASGGSAANSVIAASYFGAKCWYSCRVAKDENGEFYLKDLAEAGVSYESNRDSVEGTTGKCLVMITPDAERTMNTYLGTSEFLSIDDLNETAVADATYAYIEGYLVTSATGLPAAIRLKQLAEQHGTSTAISLSDPAIVEYFREGLLKIIGTGVDLMFCNEAEAINFTQTADLESAVEALRQHAKTFAVTRGDQGALVFDGNGLINIAANPTKAVDTNGAGDMFAGAFLCALTQGKTFEEAGQLASKASSVVVSQFGPRLRAEQHRQILESIARD